MSPLSCACGTERVHYEPVNISQHKEELLKLVVVLWNFFHEIGFSLKEFVG